MHVRKDDVFALISDLFCSLVSVRVAKVRKGLRLPVRRFTLVCTESVRVIDDDVRFEHGAAEVIVIFKMLKSIRAGVGSARARHNELRRLSVAVTLISEYLVIKRIERIGGGSDPNVHRPFRETGEGGKAAYPSEDLIIGKCAHKLSPSLVRRRHRCAFFAGPRTIGCLIYKQGHADRP